MFKRRRAYYYPREKERRQRRPVTPAPRRKRRRGLLGMLGDFVSWCFCLLLVTGAIAGGGMYLLHTRFDSAVRAHVEQKFRQAYPNHRVSVSGARRIEGQGIEFRGITIVSREAEDPMPMVHIEEMLLQCNSAIEDFLAGKLNASQLFIRRMKVNATQSIEGTWNLESLLPMPSFGGPQVPITIENSQAEVKLSKLEQPISISIQQLKLAPQTDVVSNGGSAPAKSWTYQAVLKSPEVDGLGLSGIYDVATKVWRAEGRIQGCRLNAETAKFLPQQFAECASVLSATHLTSHASFRATNDNPHRNIEFAIDGEATGHADDERLPLPLTDIKVKYFSDGRSLRVSSFSAQAGQATRLEGNCNITGFFEDAPCSLSLTAKQLRVDRRLVSCLPNEWRELWGKLAPEGDIDAHVAIEFDGREVKHTARFDCHDVSFAYHKFPYRLANGRGRIDWHGGVLEFDRFVAYANGREVEFDGRIDQPGADYSGFVEVRVRQPVPIEERLIAALPESARRVVHQLHPDGGLTLWARFDRTASNPPIAKQELKIGLQDCSIKYELFPYPLFRIQGMIEMVDNHWMLKDLSGENDTAKITCNGTWGPDEKGVTQVTLNFKGTDVPLEDELRDALRPDTQSVWSSLHPRGTIDHLDATVRFDGLTRKTKVDLVASKFGGEQNVPGRTISIQPTWLPYQLDEMQGTLRFVDGVTKLESIQGRHGHMKLSNMDAEIQTTADDHWQVAINRINIDRMELTNELLTALPKRLGDAITRLHIVGPISMAGQMTLAGMKGDTSPESTQWDLDFDVEDGGLDCGLRLEHICGGVKLTGRVDQKGLSGKGWLNVDSLFYQGIQFTRVQGPISLTDERLGLGERIDQIDEKMRPTPIVARVFGGTLASSAEVILKGDFPFKLSSELIEADLAAMSREATSKRHAVSGKTFATLQLAGTSRGAHTFVGSGKVGLRNADIYELPVMVRMFKLLRVKQPDGTAFTSSDLAYHIEGDRIYFDSIKFDGDVINMEGQGDMTLDRNINLTFYTSLASNDFGDFLLRPILKEAGKQLLEIKVTGSLDDPRVDRQPLRNIRENIQSIFPSPVQPNLPVMTRLPQTGESERPNSQR